MRPPVRLEREEEWTQLEEAWECGQAAFVMGEAGVGKSLLVRDFATSHGQWGLMEACPSNAALPFAALARGLNQVLREHSELSLPAWVRVELARLPLALAGDPPLPLPPPADKLRFLVALGGAVGLLGRVGVRTLILEDLQHADPASLEAVLYLVQRTLSPHPDPFPHLLGTFRVGELPSWALATLQHLVEAGLILQVALEPLSPQGVEQLLKSLDLSGLDPLRLAPPLARHTEGNPLFLLETLRVLWQQDRLATPQSTFPSLPGWRPS